MIVEKWGTLPRIAVLAAVIGGVTGVVAAVVAAVGALGEVSEVPAGEATLALLGNLPFNALLGAGIAVLLSYPAYFILRRWGFSQHSRAGFFWFCAGLGFAAFAAVFLVYIIGEGMASPDRFLLIEQRVADAFMTWWPYLGFALVPAALSGLASFIVAKPAGTVGPAGEGDAGLKAA